MEERYFSDAFPAFAKKAGLMLKGKIADIILVLTPPFQCLLVVFATAVFAVMPVVLVFSNFKVLGYFWLPILLAYTVFLSVVVRQIYRYQEMQAERFIYGDELFFEAYPHFKKIEERKKRFKAWRKKLRLRGKKQTDTKGAC